MVLAMERRPEGRCLAHIGLLEGNPVVPELIWSIDTGKGPGYGDFAERLGVAP